MGNNILNACKNTSNTTTTSAPGGATINGGIDGEYGENSRERRKHERKKTKKSSDTSAVHAAETLMLVAPMNIKEQQQVKSADIEQSTETLAAKHIINGSQQKVSGVVDKKNRERKTSNLSSKNNNEIQNQKRQNDAVSGTNEVKTNANGDDSSSQIINLKNNNDKYFTKEDLLYYETMLKNEKKQPPPKDKNIRWQQGEVLGTGSFGQVILGMNIDTGEFMAVKQVHIGGYNQQDRKEKVQQIQSEIEALQNFSDKNIVRYIGIKKSDTSINIFLEYVPGGSISSLLYRYNKFNETLIRKFTNQILKGLEYLHAHDVIHRDIKGANVLVDKDGNCKLADFGSAKKIVEEKGHNDSIRGTPYWMAPETIKQVGSGRFADIWSIGCTVIEMATAKPPWADKNPIQAMFYIANAVEPPPIPEGLSPECKDFISKCLRIIPSQRYNVRQLLHHPFITRKKTVTNMNHSVRQLVQITEEGTIDYQTTYSPDKRKDFLYRGDSRGNTFFHEDMNTFTEKTKAYSVKTKTQQSSKSHKSLHRKGSYNDRSADSLVELQRQKSSQSNHHRQLNTQSKHIQSRSSLVQQQHNDSVDSKLAASQSAQSQLQLYQLSEGRSILSQDKSHSSPTHQHNHQHHSHHHHQQNQQRQYNHNQSIQTQNEGERSFSESSSNKSSHCKCDDDDDDSSSNSHSIRSSSSLSNSSSNSSNSSNQNNNNSNSNKDGRWKQSEKGSVVSHKSHSSQRKIAVSQQQQQQFRKKQSNISNSSMHSPSGTPLATETNQKKRKSLFQEEQNQQKEKDKNRARKEEQEGDEEGETRQQQDHEDNNNNNNNILMNEKDQENEGEDDGLLSEGQQFLQQQVHPSAEYVHSLYHLPSQLLQQQQQPVINQTNNSSGSPTYSDGNQHLHHHHRHSHQSNSNSHRQQQQQQGGDEDDDFCDGFKTEKFQRLKYSRPLSPKRLITQHSVGSSMDHGNQTNTPLEALEHNNNHHTSQHHHHHQHSQHHHFTHNGDDDDVTNNKHLNNDGDSTQGNS